MKNALRALVLIALVLGMAHAQTAMTQTTLSAALDGSTQEFAVASATGITAPSGSVINTVLVIDNEAMNVLEVNGTSIRVARGVRQTKAAAHVSGAVVFAGAPSRFFTGKVAIGGSCSTPAYSPRVTYDGQVAYCRTLWRDALAPDTVKASAALSVTSSTTLANVTGMSLTLFPGTYKFQVVAPTIATANTGLHMAFKFGTAPTAVDVTARMYTASGLTLARSTTATDQTLYVNSASGVILQVVMEGTMTIGTQTTCQLQAAQGSSHGDTAGVYAGATMTFTRVQ